MGCAACVKKNLCSKAKYQLLCSLVCACLLTFTNFCIIRPWRIFPIDYFCYVQISTLLVIIVIKVIEMFCCGRCEDDSGSANFNTIYFFLGISFILATFDGFLHDDLDYSTV